METTCWWQRRRDGEATAVYLGRVLEDLGARDLAIKARRCHYDDYFCPDTVDDGFNIHRLIFELENWSRSATRDQRDRAKVMIRAARDGEFDGTREESEQWATSETGQEVFRELTESARDIKP